MDPFFAFLIFFAGMIAVICVVILIIVFGVSFVYVQIESLFIDKKAKRNVDAYVKENPNLFQEEEVIDTKDTLDSIIEGSLNKNNIRRVK
jgi:hypothetical protein